MAVFALGCEDFAAVFCCSGTLSLQQRLLASMTLYSPGYHFLRLTRVVVTLQKANENIDCRFELSDNLYANAKIKPQNSMFLWLGVSNLLALPHLSCPLLYAFAIHLLHCLLLSRLSSLDLMLRFLHPFPFLLHPPLASLRPTSCLSTPTTRVWLCCRRI